MPSYRRHANSDTRSVLFSSATRRTLSCLSLDPERPTILLGVQSSRMQMKHGPLGVDLTYPLYQNLGLCYRSKRCLTVLCIHGKRLWPDVLQIRCGSCGSYGNTPLRVRSGPWPLLWRELLGFRVSGLFRIALSFNTDRGLASASSLNKLAPTASIPAALFASLIGNLGAA